MKDAGWYYTASKEDQKAVVTKMMQLWNFSASPLGMLQSTLQVIFKVSPQHARYLLDLIASNNYGLMLHIARQTCPKLDRDEQVMAARVKPILSRSLPFKTEEEVDALIMSAIKYEEMRGKGSDDFLHHIMKKLKYPDRFQQEQFAKYRGLL